MPKMKRKPRKTAKTKEQLALERELEEELKGGSMPDGMADMLAALQGIPPNTETNEQKDKP